MTKKTKSAQIGRPKLSDDEARSEVIRMRATKAEKAAYIERGGDEWFRRELARKPRFVGARRERWPQKEGTDE